MGLYMGFTEPKRKSRQAGGAAGRVMHKLWGTGVTKDYTVSLLVIQQCVEADVQPTGGLDYDQGLHGQPA